MSDISVIRPGGPDAVAKTLYAWAQGVINKINSSNHNLAKDLSGKIACRINSETALSQSDLIIFFGHGKPDSLLNDQTAIVDHGNISEASGHSIIAIACRSSEKLGPHGIGAGLKAYLGFERDFGWVVATGNSSSWRTQNTFVAGIEEILKPGARISEVYDAIKNGFDDMTDYFDRHPTGRGELDAMLAKVWSNWNMTWFRLTGDPDVTL